MTAKRPKLQPDDVVAEDGEVLIDGPGGIAASMTPQAAEATAQRLRDGAAKARKQRRAQGG